MELFNVNRNDAWAFYLASFGPKQEKGYFQKESTKYVNQNVNKWKIQ